MPALTRQRAAYNQTVEDSLYLDKYFLSKGIGRQMLTAFINGTTARDFYQMMAVIGDPVYTAAIGPHSALGFCHIGAAREIGFKFGRRLVSFCTQRALRNGPVNRQCVQAPFRVKEKLSA